MVVVEVTMLIVSVVTSVPQVVSEPLPFGMPSTLAHIVYAGAPVMAVVVVVDPVIVVVKVVSSGPGSWNEA